MFITRTFSNATAKYSTGSIFKIKIKPKAYYKIISWDAESAGPRYDKFVDDGFYIPPPELVVIYKKIGTINIFHRNEQNSPKLQLLPRTIFEKIINDGIIELISQEQMTSELNDKTNG